MKNYVFDLKSIKQLENYIVINSIKSIKQNKFNLNDLVSRINSFVFIGIDSTDDLLQNSFQIIFRQTN